LQCFATEPAAAQIARNNAFAPQFRCALDGIELIAMTAAAGAEYAPRMTQPHHMSKPTDAGMARFTALLDELSSERDVVKASMFGMPGIKRRGGKAFCGLYGDDMIFKLEGEDHARALGLDGAHLFEPMAGRPMKAWVQIPPEHQSQYGELARAAEASLGD
jgi:hypothetical protein